MKIWLDDDPVRDTWVDDTWVIVRTAKEAVSLIWAHLEDVEEVSLDHDLGDADGWTGYDVISYYEEWVGLGITDHVPIFTIHSANPVGRKNMQAAIDSIERLRNGNV